MKKIILITLLITFCFAAISGSAKTGIYLGVKGGMFTVDKVSAIDIFSIGGITGYMLPFKISFIDLAAEIDYNVGYFGGDHVSGYVGDRIHIRTLCGYAVLKTKPSKDVYMKFKIGASHEVTLEKIQGVETISREIGPSFGIGAGFKTTENVNLEADFATTNSNMKFFSVGFNVMF